MPASDVPGEAAFPTQPIPVKPPPIARVGYTPADLVTAADTTRNTPRRAQELVETSGGVDNAGPFTPWGYRAEGAPPATTLVFPGGLGGANWGGTAFDPGSRLSSSSPRRTWARSGGWRRRRDGSPVPYEKATGRRPARRSTSAWATCSWPCQKPPWGRLMAVNAATGDVAWQMPLGITEQLPAGKQNTGRPVLAGPIVTAGGVVFIASTDDNRFRALDAKTGRELWVTRLESAATPIR